MTWLSRINWPDPIAWLSQGSGPWGSGPRGGGNSGGSGGPSEGGSGSSGSGGSGGSGNSGGPWGAGPRGNGGSPPPRGRGPQPPNLEDILRRSQDQMRRMMPGGVGMGTGIGLVAIVIAVIWLGSGFYRVLPDEVGVVLRFGAYNRTTFPGLNYHLPRPIESVLRPKVTRVNRTEVGFRAADQNTARSPSNRQVAEEALMLTGDENIVDINFSVFWVIKDERAYLFNIRAPEATVKSAAESAMREVVGHTPIAQALAEGRGQIETEMQKLLQSILDAYGSGISITQVQLLKVDPPADVIDAFRDVQRARADQERNRNEAEAYRNDIVPRARGEAAQIQQNADAYRQEIIARAIGDAERFNSVYRAYAAAKDVTQQRLYLETLEDVLRNSRKIVIDKAAGGAGGVVPYLPLNELERGLSAEPAPSANATAPPPNSVPSMQPPPAAAPRGRP